MPDRVRFTRPGTRVRYRSAGQSGNAGPMALADPPIMPAVWPSRDPSTSGVMQRVPSAITPGRTAGVGALASHPLARVRADVPRATAVDAPDRTDRCAARDRLGRGRRRFGQDRRNRRGRRRGRCRCRRKRRFRGKRRYRGNRRCRGNGRWRGRRGWSGGGGRLGCRRPAESRRRWCRRRRGGRRPSVRRRPGPRRRRVGGRATGCSERAGPGRPTTPPRPVMSRIAVVLLNALVAAEVSVTRNRPSPTPRTISGSSSHQRSSHGSFMSFSPRR